MVCSIGTSTPMSPVAMFMVPTKATAMISNRCCAFGMARPVTVIRTAPASRRLRRSKRGASQPTVRVSSAAPESAAVATSPTCAGS